MTTADVATEFVYRIGEEVVVRLAGVEAFDVAAGDRVDAALLPSWTIAAVTARTSFEGLPHYAVRFRHVDARCVAVVPEDAIDGVA